MDLERILRAASDLSTIRVALAAVGIGLAVLTALVFAIRLLRRKPIKKPDAIALFVMLLLGAGLCAFARYGILIPEPAPNPLGYAAVVAGPAEVTDQAALTVLRTAQLTPESPATTTEDWPQWRGAGRDGISPATGLRTDWTRDPPKLVWKKPVGRGYASLSVVGNRAYLLDYDGKGFERVYCLDAATGNDIWVYRYETNRKGGGYAGPRATPTVFDGRVYTVGADGHFLCLEADPPDHQPKVLWEHMLMAEFNAPMPGHGAACSPLIEGDSVIVQPGGKDASVVAFDRKTGKMAWGSMSDPASYSSPVAATVAGVRQVIAFTARGVGGVRAADGNPLWHFTWATSFDVNAATPIVAGDYVFVSSGYGVGCALVHVSATKDGGVEAKPVYVRKGKLMRNHHMTCVLRDGYLYGCDDSGRQELKCVDLRAGEEKWATEKVGKHTLIYADGHLIALNEEGTLVLAECSPKGYHEKGRLTGILSGSECWALPALANGRLYIRGHHDAFCLDLRSTAHAQAK